MRTHIASRGFSLIEALIVSALVAALSIVFALFFIHVHGEFFGARAAAEVQQEASAVVRELEQFVLPAARIIEEVSIGSDDYTTGAQELIVEVPSVDASGDSIDGVVDTVVFYLDGTTCLRRVVADAQSARVSGTRQVATSIDQLTFSYATEDVTLSSTVSVELSASAQVQDRIITTERRAQFSLRNFTL